MSYTNRENSTRPLRAERTLTRQPPATTTTTTIAISAPATTSHHHHHHHYYFALQVRRKPKIPKGARDFMPDQMAIREV
jgi:hypothetical protein